MLLRLGVTVKVPTPSFYDNGHGFLHLRYRPCSDPSSGFVGRSLDCVESNTLDAKCQETFRDTKNVFTSLAIKGMWLVSKSVMILSDFHSRLIDTWKCWKEHIRSNRSLLVLCVCHTPVTFCSVNSVHLIEEGGRDGLAKINILRFRPINVSLTKNFSPVLVFWYESGISNAVELGRRSVSFRRAWLRPGSSDFEKPLLRISRIIGTLARTSDENFALRISSSYIFEIEAVSLTTRSLGLRRNRWTLISSGSRKPPVRIEEPQVFKIVLQTKWLNGSHIY